MKAYSLAIAQSAENNEPDTPVAYPQARSSTEDGQDASSGDGAVYDTAQKDEEKNEESALSGLLTKFSKSKESTAFGASAGLILNLAQKKSRSVPNDSFLQLSESQGEMEMLDLGDDDDEAP